MTAFRIRAAAALWLAGVALGVPASAQQTEQPAPAQQAQPSQPRDVVKATHGAWEIHCIDGTETCAIQQIGNTSDGKRAMQVTVERLAGVEAQGQNIPAAMTVRTPLGVLIPYLVRVQIDQGEVQQIPLVRCLPDSCVARAPLTQQAVDQLKRGGTAKFTFFLSEEVPVTISLNGFTKAYDELKPIAPELQN